jgi:hypothetical protein
MVSSTLSHPYPTEITAIYYTCLPGLGDQMNSSSLTRLGMTDFKFLLMLYENIFGF